MACIITLDNATQLGWDVSYEYTDNDSEKLKKIKNVQVEVLAVDLNNTTGVGDCVAPIELLRNKRNWSEIVIHSHNFGSGKLQSFDMSQGTFVNEATANLSYTIEENIEGGGPCWITGAGGPYYNGLPLTDPLLSPENLENLSEDFNFSSGDNGSASFSHSLSVQFNNLQDIATDTSEDYAKTNVLKAQKLAKEIFHANPQPPFGISVLDDILQQNDLVTYYSENLDYINASCSFEKSYDLNSQDCTANACSSYDVAYNRTQCVESVSINGSVEGRVGNKIDGATADWEGTEEGLIPTRLTDVFNRFRVEGGASLNTDKAGDLILNNVCTTVNEFEGTIGYSAEANNDPKATGNCTLTRSQTVSYTKQENPPAPPKEVITVSENGNVQGKGKKRHFTGTKTTNPAYNNAQTCYTSLKEGAETRCKDLYPGTDSSTLKRVGQSYKKSPYQGTLSYSVKYSDDPELNDDECIKKTTINVSDTKLMKRTAISNPPNHASIVQEFGNEKPKRSISVTMAGGTGECAGLDKFLESGKAILDDRKATCYINSINYNYSENKDGKNFSLNAEFVDE